MTDDKELIARLRAKKQKGNRFDSLEYEAADRIEALSAERDRWKDACRSASRDLNIVVPDNDRLKSERDAAEAKLAENEVRLLKVVEALDGLLRHEPDYSDTLWQEARTTLAEISSEAALNKGESHD